MGPGFFDIIVNAFVMALQRGFVTLSVYSLGILAFCGIVAYLSSMWPVVLGGGDGLAPALLIIVRIGLFYFFTVSLGALSIAALNTFLQWGAAPGGAFPAAAFLSPSTIVEIGFRAAWPIQTFLAQYSGWAVAAQFLDCGAVHARLLADYSGLCAGRVAHDDHDYRVLFCDHVCRGVVSVGRAVPDGVFV